MYGKEPDCAACMPVDLNQENMLPFAIYQQCRSQMIMGGMSGEAVDISIPAVKIVMDFHGVGDSRCIFEKVMMAARAEIHESHEIRKNERQTKGK